MNPIDCFLNLHSHSHRNCFEKVIRAPKLCFAEELIFSNNSNIFRVARPLTSDKTNNNVNKNSVNSKLYRKNLKLQGCLSTIILSEDGGNLSIFKTKKIEPKLKYDKDKSLMSETNQPLNISVLRRSERIKHKQSFIANDTYKSPVKSRIKPIVVDDTYKNPVKSRIKPIVVDDSYKSPVKSRIEPIVIDLVSPKEKNNKLSNQISLNKGESSQTTLNGKTKLNKCQEFKNTSNVNGAICDPITSLSTDVKNGRKGTVLQSIRENGQDKVNLRTRNKENKKNQQKNENLERQLRNGNKENKVVRQPKNGNKENKVKQPKNRNIENKVKQPKKGNKENKVEQPKTGNIENKLNQPKNGNKENKVKQPKNGNKENDVKQPKNGNKENKVKQLKNGNKENEVKQPKNGNKENEVKQPKNGNKENKEKQDSQYEDKLRDNKDKISLPKLKKQKVSKTVDAQIEDPEHQVDEAVFASNHKKLNSADNLSAGIVANPGTLKYLSQRHDILSNHLQSADETDLFESSFGKKNKRLFDLMEDDEDEPITFKTPNEKGKPSERCPGITPRTALLGGWEKNVTTPKSPVKASKSKNKQDTLHVLYHHLKQKKSSKRSKRPKKDYLDVCNKQTSGVSIQLPNIPEEDKNDDESSFDDYFNASC